MRRLLLLLLAALVITTIAAQTRAHAATLPGIHAAEQCPPHCTADLSEPPQRARPPPAATPMQLAVLVCMTMTTLGLLVVAARVHKYRRSSAAREAQLVQEWAIGAALARKQTGSSAHTAVHSRPEPKAATAKRPPIVPRTADCYWTYQARQPR